MGDKIKARETISKTSIPLVPGSKGNISDTINLKKTAKEISYPLIIKASFRRWRKRNEGCK